MSTVEQYVLVGVARAREQWAADLARWSTSGAAPIEFVKCVSNDEARMVLGSGRRASALLVDARGAGVDRDLVAAAAAAEVPTIVVTDGSIHRDWEALGCAAVVRHRGAPDEWLEVLGRHTAAVDRSRRPGRSILHPAAGPTRGRLLLVLGSGGTGASTVAMAVAQVLAQHPPAVPATDESAAEGPAAEGAVVLVDGARRGDLAMFHDLGDVVPGLPELVEAHRSDRLDPDDVRRLTFAVDSRGYSVLLGRRRSADWVTLRRRPVDAAIDALRRSFAWVVVDADADLDGHGDTGSADVDDRHAVTLGALRVADAVLVVGRPDLQGVHKLAGLLDEVLVAGAPPHRVLPVVVGTSRSGVSRARVGDAVAKLAGSGPEDEPVGPPVHLPAARHLDDVHDRVAPLPAALCRPLQRTVPRLLDEVGPRARSETAPEVRAGELAVDVDRPLGTDREVA